MAGHGLPRRDGQDLLCRLVAVQFHADGVIAGRDVRQGGVRHLTGLGAVEEDPGAVGNRGDGDAPRRGDKTEVDRCGLAVFDRDVCRRVRIPGYLHGDGMLSGGDVGEGSVGRPAGLDAVDPDRCAGRRRGDGDAPGGLDEGEVEGGGLVLCDGYSGHGVDVAALLEGDVVIADADPVDGGVGDLTHILPVDEDRGAVGRRGDFKAADSVGQGEVDLRHLAFGDRDRRRGVGVAVEFQGDDVVAGRDVCQRGVGHLPGVFPVEPDRRTGGGRGDEDAAGRSRVLEDQDGGGGVHVVAVRAGIVTLEACLVRAVQNRIGHVVGGEPELRACLVVYPEPGILPVVEEELTLFGVAGREKDGNRPGVQEVGGIDAREGCIRRCFVGRGRIGGAGVEHVKFVVDLDGLLGLRGVFVHDDEVGAVETVIVPFFGDEGHAVAGGIELIGYVIDVQPVGVAVRPEVLDIPVGRRGRDRIAVERERECRIASHLVVGVALVEPGAHDRGVFGDREIGNGPVPGPLGPRRPVVGGVPGRVDDAIPPREGRLCRQIVAAGPAFAAVAVIDDGFLDAEPVILFVRFGHGVFRVGDDGDRHVVARLAHGLVGPGDGGVCPGGEAVDGDRAGDLADVEPDGERARVAGPDVGDRRRVGVAGGGEDLVAVRREGRDCEVGAVPTGGSAGRDVVGLQFGIAAVVVADREVNRVGPGLRIGVDRVLLVAGRVVPEVPGPGGRRTGGGVVELHRKRCLTGGHIRLEVSDRSAPAAGGVFHGKRCERGLVRVCSAVQHVGEIAVAAGGQVVPDVPGVRSKVTRWGCTRIGGAVERVQGVLGREHDVLEGCIRPAGGESAGGEGRGHPACAACLVVVPVVHPVVHFVAVAVVVSDHEGELFDAAVEVRGHRG